MATNTVDEPECTFMTARRDAQAQQTRLGMAAALTVERVRNELGQYCGHMLYHVVWIYIEGYPGLIVSDTVPH